MKTELINLISKYYKNLPQEKINDFANKMCEMLPSKVVKLSEVKTGTKFKFKGYEFTKLADEEKSSYCLLNESIFESEFGKTNDWAKSPIRALLNTFDKNGNSKIKGINKNDLVPVSLNYSTYKIPNGRTTDRITILSYDEQICWSILAIDKCEWLRSGNRDFTWHSRYLSSSGAANYALTSRSLVVRPALHFRNDLEVKI